MEAPFYIGQKVVALSNSKHSKFRVKGNQYTILGIDKCVKCGVWAVDIGDNVFGLTRCVCGHREIYTFWPHLASSFAPVQESKERIRYVAVSESLREVAEEVVINSTLNS